MKRMPYQNQNLLSKGGALIVLLVLGFITPAHSRPAHGVRIAGVLGAATTLLSEECPGTCQKPSIRLSTFIDGIGRVQFLFDARNPSERSIRYGEKEQVREQLRPITLLRGRARGRNFEARSVGSIQVLDGRKYLTASLLLEGSRRNRLYRIRFPLDAPEEAKVSRASLTPHSISCAQHEMIHPLQQMDPPKSFTPESLAGGEEPLLESGAARQLDLGVFTDKEWSERFGSFAGSQAVSHMMEAELVFSEQLNIFFNVRDTVVNPTYDSVAQAGSTDAAAILISFQPFAQGTSAFGRSDLYHLMTGVDFAGGTIGVAYVGVTCSSQNNAFGTTSFTNSTLTPVTVAHELGHNFGAFHSATGLMAATATGEGISTIRFSNFSLNQVNDHLTNSPSCLASIDAPDDGGGSDPEPEPEPEPDPDNGDDTPGGGGGGGGGGDTDTPTFTFEASLTRQGTLSFSAASSRAEADCELELQYVINNGSSKTFATIPMSGSSLTGTATLARRAKNQNKRGKRLRYFVMGRYSCPGSLFSTRSTAVRVRPDRVKSKGKGRKKRLGGGRWFRSIGNLFGGAS